MMLTPLSFVLVVALSSSPTVVVESGRLGETRHVVGLRHGDGVVQLDVDVPASSLGQAWGFDASRYCRLALVNSSPKGWTLSLSDPGGKNRRVLFTSTDALSSPAFSPSGDRIAVVTNSQSWSEQRVVVFDMNGRRVADTPGFVAGWLSEKEFVALRFIDVTKRERPCFQVVRMNLDAKEPEVIKKSCASVALLHSTGTASEPTLLVLKEGGWVVWSAKAERSLDARPHTVPFPFGVQGQVFAWFRDLGLRSANDPTKGAPFQFLDWLVPDGNVLKTAICTPNQGLAPAEER